MLTIIDSNATPHPSRTFAEEAWRHNPALSPAWWRENGGFCHSKFIYSGLPLPEAINAAFIEEGETPPQGCVTFAQSPILPATFSTNVFIWQTPTNLSDTQALETLTALETACAQGHLSFYGLQDDALAHPQTHRPLHTWLSLAATAAEKAWGRKKRPMLRALVHPLSLLDLSLLSEPNTLQHAQAMSALELASRLSLWVIAVPLVWPDNNTPNPQALEALMAVAQAEKNLHTHLQGQWPHVQGKPLFAVLPALQQGQTPWPSPAMHAAWEGSVQPTLISHFQTLAPSPEREALITAWKALFPHTQALANAAGAAALGQGLEALKPKLPAGYEALSPTQLQAMILASLPGIGGVKVASSMALSSLYDLPDIPDMGQLIKSL